MGAVAEGEEPTIVRNDDVVELSGVSAQEFDVVYREERAEIERRRKHYLGDRVRSEVRGQFAIVVYDGIATGATTLAAIRAVRSREPKELVLAVPVAPLDTINKLQPEVDAIVCLDAPEDLAAIGYFYRDFHQVSDDEVIATFPANRSMHAPENKS